MMNENSMIKYLIGASRIKYTVLDDITREICAPNGRILMLVDAHSIFYRLFRNKDLTAIYAIPEEVAVKDIVISFLNVLGHYRRYFKTRMNCTNDIVVFFNREIPTYQGVYFPEYQKDLYAKYQFSHKDYGGLNGIVEKAMKFIASLVPYFEGIYYIDVPGLDDYAGMVKVMEEQQYKDFYRIIFSRNMICTQLLDEMTVQLYNKRDNSYLITERSAFTQGILKDKKTEAPETMTPTMLPFIWTLGGCSDVGLKKTKYTNGVTGAVKDLTQLVTQKFVTPDMSIQSFLQAIAKYGEFDHKAELRMIPTSLINRHKVVNLRLAAAALTDAQVQNIYKSQIDLFDQNMLEEINEKLSNINSDGELLEITNLNMATAEEVDEIPWWQFG